MVILVIKILLNLEKSKFVKITPSGLNESHVHSISITRVAKLSNKQIMDKVLIIDFGSQVTKLIARRIRELGIYSEVIPYFKVKKDILKSNNTKGIIFSGGPRSVNLKDSPKLPNFVYDSSIPILGICYGLQLIAKNLEEQ